MEFFLWGSVRTLYIVLSMIIDGAVFSVSNILILSFVFFSLSSLDLRRPAKNLTRQELKRDSRRTIATIRATLRANNYRKDLVNPAVRRACAILKSKKKPVVIKKKARVTKKQ